MNEGFPFSAVVGMDELRLALILNAVDPAVGGVLVRGEKGTAKSTMVRALAAVLPEVAVVGGCRFSCDPARPGPGCPDGPHEPGADTRTRPARLVELPVGATEDRLTGALDIERALTEGVKAYEPGLLAAAHRGVLYVDEVNLLPDHLVDLLLDAAALGTCYVERDGVSVRHAARFLLVGTMNPEEGELRPQLLDRFGLTARAAAPAEPGARAEVVRRRLAYEADPASFTAAWRDTEDGLAARVAAARQQLPQVTLPDAALRLLTGICAAFGVDGLRADLVTARAAVAHAAWEGRGEVTSSDIRAAAALSLPHRRRRQPFDPPTLDQSELDRALDEAEQAAHEPSAGAGPAASAGGGGGAEGRGEDGRSGAASASPDDDPEPDPASPPPGAGREVSAGAPTHRDGTSPPSSSPMPPQAHHPTGTGAAHGGHQNGLPSARPRTQVAAPAPISGSVRRLSLPGIGAGAPGRRSRAVNNTGRVTGSRVPSGVIRHIHLPATMAAAAPHQRARERVTDLVVRREDVREPRREGRESNLVLFAVDASGSMAARQRMSAVKGAVLSLLLDAYQRRDKVGVVTFRGGGAELLLPPTSSVEAAVPRLAALPTGGRTPLAAGLLRAHAVLRTERLRDPRRRALLLLITDGRATAAPGGAEPVAAAHRAAAALAGAGVASVVVDCEAGPVRLGLAAAVAAALRAPVLRLADLAASPLADTVRAYREVA